mmetsp:Transcript_32146/g.49160  ORF Transcript_32146/g.49160 Transcript_32146/m.49160 type:complete len:183 (-) Transcript_32146:13-561(-)
MHHFGAAKYYKINIIFLMAFLGLSYFNYKRNVNIFINDKLANIYLGTLTGLIAALWLFSNKQIQALYLMKGSDRIGIRTYSNFGFTYNRMKFVPVEQLQGSRLMWKKEMNLYQLEYAFQGRFMKRLTKRRSYFYRPEFISDRALWDDLKRGTSIKTLEDLTEAEMHAYSTRTLKERAMAKYR